MIAVFGSQEESMIEEVCNELARRSQPFLWLDNAHLPSSVALTYRSDRGLSFLVEGQSLAIPPQASIYHRLGFSRFETAADYTPEEEAFVAHECSNALQAYLNVHPGLVVNPPFRSASNASKPYQASLVPQFGFSLAETLVTNLPEAAEAFYNAFPQGVIYKSISYLRSLVQPFLPEDLERLDTLSNCPIQLQERVEGFDVRVHVVGERYFASKITATLADYRYDKQAEVEAWDLPEPWGERCLQLAQALGMHLSGIDLRFAPDGRVFCFEANPSPAFSWYEARTEQPITSALCDLLVQREG